MGAFEHGSYFLILGLLRKMIQIQQRKVKWGRYKALCQVSHSTDKHNRALRGKRPRPERLTGVCLV